MNAAGERSTWLLPEEPSQPTQTHYNNTTEKKNPPHTADLNPLSSPRFISVLMAFDGWIEVLFILPVRARFKASGPRMLTTLKALVNLVWKCCGQRFPLVTLTRLRLNDFKAATERRCYSRPGATEGVRRIPPTDPWSQRDKTPASRTHHSNVYQTGTAL